MGEFPRMQPAPRARPLAGLPVEALAARGGELATRWAAALVLACPPERIGEIPLEDIALDGPALCVQVLRALEADDELHRLTGRWPGSGREASATARRLAAIVGARDAASAAESVEALRGVLWEALAGELGAAPARQGADACDRLAHVCAAALAAAVSTMEPGEPQLLLDERELEVAGRERAAAPERATAPERAAGRVASTPSAVTAAVIVDERPSPPLRVAAGREPPAAAAAGSSPEIAIRDERGGGEGPAAWIGSVGRQLERFALDGLPFAVLLLELSDLARVHADEGPTEADRLEQEVRERLESEMRAPTAGPSPAGEPATVTSERAGRYWLLAPRTDRHGAQLLAERLAAAAGTVRTAGGRSSAVAIGTAACPQDGREAAALAAHADVGLYAARSAARMVEQPL
jgi:GGDEF domain-containing protein